MQFHDLSGAASARGLEPNDALEVARLVSVWQNRQMRNHRLLDYYEDNIGVREIGVRLRDDVAKNLEVGCSWVEDAIDVIASRVVIDGYTTDDEEIHGKIDRIFRDGFTSEVSRSIAPHMVMGFGGWASIPGDESNGEPPVIVKFKDALTSSAIWSGRRNEVRCAMSIEDWTLGADGEPESPSLIVVYLRDTYIEIERDEGEWFAAYKPHNLNRVPFVPMVYRKSDKRFGKSRINKAMMGYVDSYKREMELLAIHSEYHSIPKKMLLNASEEFVRNADKMKLRDDAVTIIGKDEDGDTVDVKEFSAASPVGHIEVINDLARKFAASAKLPASYFGADSGTAYTSNDALRANLDAAVSEAKNVIRDAGDALVELAIVSIALMDGKTYAAEHDAVAGKITAHFLDPAMPSASQVADQIVKYCSVMPEFAGTDVCLEMMGFDEDTRKRARAQMQENKGLTIAASVFA